jgi:hypothetical protein
MRAKQATPPAAPPSVVMPKGGKTAALARRLVVQNRSGDTP